MPRKKMAKAKTQEPDPARAPAKAGDPAMSPEAPSAPTLPSGASVPVGWRAEDFDPLDADVIALVVAELPPSTMAAQSRYRPEIAARILIRVSNGTTARVACAMEGIQPVTFRMWCMAMPALQKAWMNARVEKASSLFEEVLALSRALQEGNPSTNKVAALRVATDNLRWAAAKLDPQFSERPASQIVAIQINSGLDLGARGVAGRPAPAGPQGFTYAIEATITDVPDEAAQPPSKATLRTVEEARRRHLKRPAKKDAAP